MYEESHGTITIATNVLNTIARLTTLNVPGVARLGTSGQLLQPAGGVNVRVAEGRVKAEIFVIVKPETVIKRSLAFSVRVRSGLNAMWRR